MQVYFGAACRARQGQRTLNPLLYKDLRSAIAAPAGEVVTSHAAASWCHSVFFAKRAFQPAIRVTHLTYPSHLCALALHWDGVLRWFTSRITNGVVEAINVLIKSARRKARGSQVERDAVDPC